MKKLILIGFLLMLGLSLIGCSNDSSVTLLDDKGKQVAIENRDKPALVFFFTGVA